MYETSESLYELESNTAARWSAEMAEFESDVDTMHRLAELAGKRGYAVVESLVHTYRNHRLVERVVALSTDELRHNGYLTLMGHVVLVTGEDLRFESLIRR